MKSGRERLREWVERSKFTTQKEAAELLGVHPVVLNQWLSGARSPELENAHLIEDITGIATESWMLSDVSTPGEPDAGDGRKRKVASR